MYERLIGELHAKLIRLVAVVTRAPADSAKVQTH